jgi:hypothetical protein
MKLTGKVLAAPALVPHQLITTVGAHVVKSAHATVFAADDEDRSLANRQVFYQIAPRLRQFLDTAYVQPGFAEDSFTFEFEV